MIKKIKKFLDTHYYPKTDKSYAFLIKTFNEGVQNSLLGVRAAAIAFKLIMAAIPLLIVILNLLPSFFTYENLNNFVLLMKEYLPSNIFTVIDGPINYILFSTTRGYTGVWIFVALFIALNGVRLIIESFNASFHIKETRPVWEQFITAFIIWLLITFLLVLSIVLFLINKDFFNWLVSLEIISENLIKSFYFFAKYLIFFLLLIILFEIIFYIAPARRRKFRFMTSGTIIAALSTLIITGGFDIFISNFSNYNKIYGPLATVFIFFLWLQTVAFMILVGFEINAVVYLAEEENPRHIIPKINFKKLIPKRTKKLINDEFQEKENRGPE
jgi:membrane protein